MTSTSFFGTSAGKASLVGAGAMVLSAVAAALITSRDRTSSPSPIRCTDRGRLRVPVDRSLIDNPSFEAGDQGWDGQNSVVVGKPCSRRAAQRTGHRGEGDDEGLAGSVLHR
jgi:hypothetical protein